MSKLFTEKQISLLRYFVEQVNEGSMQDDEILVSEGIGGPELLDGSVPHGLSRNNLLFLEKEGMIVISKGTYMWTCGLTALAFQVVERNFTAKNPEINEGRLLTFLDKCFTLNEIEELCHQLGVDSGNIAGDTKRMKAKNLIEHMRNRSRVEELVLTALSID